MYKLIEIAFNVDLPLCTNIREGISFPHCSGIVINKNAIIGEKCTIFQNVTIGVDGYWEGCGTPVIGNNVVIGAGSIIIGKVRISSNSIIAAGSVVTKDVETNTIVAGNPAKCISRTAIERIKYFT